MNQQVVEPTVWTRAEGAGRLAWFTPAAVPTTEPNRRAETIRLLVDAAIVPRLAAAHPRAQPHTAPPPGDYTPAVLHLVDLLLGQPDEAAVCAHVNGLLAGGASADAIYLDLFQPAARRIGELWCDDLCSFVDVTIAVGALQHLVQEVSLAFHQESRAVDIARHALLVPLPGEQHTFGLSLVTEFFQRAGWSVEGTVSDSREGLGETVAATAFAVVGFSIGSESRLDDLAAAVRTVRRRTCNRDVKVLVGGPVFVTNPDYAATVGADATGGDARQALGQAEGFFASAARR